MKRIAFFFLLAASVAFSQTQSKPAANPASPAPKSTAQSSAPKPGQAAAAKPKSDMPAVPGVPKTLFVERYEDIKVGTGPEAVPNKLYSVLYTGYLASTGQKFDSSSDHPAPVMKDGKPVLDADGKPQLGPPQPLMFPQGMARLIPGFDQAFGGMHVGGKRRVFIPWQLAYGTHEMPAREGHIGIPPKSDLIFDVELVDMKDMPAQPLGGGAPVPRPTPPPTPNGQPSAPPTGTAPATPPTGGAPSTPPPPAK